MAKKGTHKPAPQTLNRDTAKSGANPDKDNETKKSHPPITKYILFLGIIAFCIYANTLQNGYAYDDLSAIQQNVLVRKGITAIPEILSTPYHQGGHETGKLIKNDLYRPLSLVMFAIEYQLSGNNPMLSHFINVLLYVGCVILLFLFFYHLFNKKRPLLAFIGSLLFAIHPIHTEVVANIKSRDELLCFFFGFLSLYIFFKYLDTNKKAFLVYGMLFYFLSLLSKETSIMLFIIIPFIFFFYRNENKKYSINISVFSTLAVVIYLAIRFPVLMLHNVYHPSRLLFIDNALIGVPSLATRLATEILILGYYIKLLIIPYPLICDYAYQAIPFANFSDITVWLSLVGYIFFIYLSISLLIKKRPAYSFKPGGNDPIAFGAVFFLVTISLFSNIFFFIGSEMAERFMFFPSVGFCLMAGVILEKLVLKPEVSDITSIKNNIVLAVLAPISLIFIGMTFLRNRDWKDSLTLFQADSKKSPNNSRLYYFAGHEEIAASNEEGIDAATKQQMFGDGIINLQKSLAIYPGYIEAQDEVAYAFIIAMQLDSAEVHCKKAIMINHNDFTAMNNLAIIYTAKQKYPEAIAYDRMASTVNPTNAYYPGNIGVCNVHMNRYDSAIYYLRKSIAIDSSKIRYVKFIAVVFNRMGQRDSAKRYEAIAKHYEPNYDVGSSPMPN